MYVAYIGTYAVAIGYCFIDVGYEAYKLKNRGYVTEKNHPMSMSQVGGWAIGVYVHVCMYV